MNDKINVKMIEWFDDHFYKVEYEKEIEGKEKETVTLYIPSVTTKLGVISAPFLIQWYGDIGTREANRRKEEAGDRGSRIHHAWMTYSLGGAVIFNDLKHPVYTQQEIVDIEKKFSCISILRSQEEMFQMTKLKKFLDVLKPLETKSEMIVYDIDNMDAGTVDNLFLIAEGDYLISGPKPIHLLEGWYVFDLKTGKAVGQARKQVAAYFKCTRAMGLCDPVGTIIGHTGSTTKGGIAGFAADVMFKEEVEEEYNGYRKAAALWEIESGSMKPKVFEIPTLIYKEELKNDAA